MTRDNSQANRRNPRVATPKGVWVAWQNDKQQNVSRVRDLNVGGMFIATPTPLAAGTVLPLLMSVPEGEIRGKATVRNLIPGEGMGVQFTEIGAESQARLDKLVARLLMAESNNSGSNSSSQPK